MVRLSLPAAHVRIAIFVLLCFGCVASTAPDDSYGKVAVVPLDHPDGPRYVTSLE